MVRLVGFENREDDVNHFTTNVAYTDVMMFPLRLLSVIKSLNSWIMDNGVDDKLNLAENDK